jgi:hypothetical protein
MGILRTLARLGSPLLQPRTPRASSGSALVAGERTAPCSMRLDPDLKKALEQQAAAENRSLTNYVETLLWRAVDKTAGT